MKSILLTIIVFAFFGLVSCNPAKKDSVQTDQVPTQEQQATESMDLDEPVKIETIQEFAIEQDTAEVMLNPPHGEPFHRCEIPVGEPLTSLPANTAMQKTTPQITTTPQPTQNQVKATAPVIANNPSGPTIENARRLNNSQTQKTPASAPATGAKPNINPPHGQPWHRCDIAVGSPLP